MKIATKISAGYAILIALIVGVLAYQLSIFSQMQSINQNLSGINFRAAILSLQIVRDLDQVEEFTLKLFATQGDPDYASQLGGMRDASTQDIEQLQSFSLSPAEKIEVGDLSRRWTELSKVSSDQEKNFRSLNLAQMQTALSDQLLLLTRLRDQAQVVIRTTRLAVESQVERSSAAGHRAQRISWIAALSSLLLSLFVSIWILRSILGPLRHLTEGTRAVAEGKFFYQLDDTGNDELAQLAADFNQMTRRLSELDEMKKDFVSHVSHELKTPLASVEETIRLLLEEIPGPLNEEQRRFLQLNLQSSQRLSAMIGNLLDLSRLEAGVMQYEIRKHDFVDVVRVALAEFEVPFSEKGIQVQQELPDEPLTVRCDRDRMIQVLGNLLGNALKFSPRQSPLQVRLTALPEIPLNVPPSWLERISSSRDGEAFALLSVADCGPGIPSAEKEKIFGKFHQAKQGKKFAGQGTGLGLAIGRTIVEAHRGAIWVEDNPGGGSVFNVLLTTGAVAERVAIRTSSPI